MYVITLLRAFVNCRLPLPLNPDEERLSYLERLLHGQALHGVSPVELSEPVRQRFRVHQGQFRSGRVDKVIPGIAHELVQADQLSFCKTSTMVYGLYNAKI